MKKVVLSKDELYKLLSRNPDYNGREGNLYRVGDYLYKLYHNPYLYGISRLEQIISFQDVITRTKLPVGAVYFGTQFIGAILHDFFHATALETLNQLPIEKRVQKLRELSLSLQELTHHGLVLNDLFYENLILSEHNTIEIIDIDGDNIRLLTNEHQLQVMLNEFRYIILECFSKEAEALKLPKVTFLPANTLHFTYDDIEELLNEICLKANQKVLK